MSYNPKLLFEDIAASLRENPGRTLRELSQRLHVSQGTIEKAVRLSTGGSFRHFHQENLLVRVSLLLKSDPEMTIKELSFSVGFKSASSFARAVKRVSGLSPGQLRSGSFELPGTWKTATSVQNRL